jgi:tRNA(fMet)-specific endonuclease VapC
VIDDGDDVAVAAITIAELRVGVELTSGKARVESEAFLNDVIESTPILPYTVAVADAHAQLLVAVRRQGRPRGAHDLIIAATARAAGRRVVSADPSAFEDLPGVTLQTHR